MEKWKTPRSIHFYEWMRSIYEYKRCVGEKSAWSIPVNFFSLLSRLPVEKKSKRGVSRAQISVHRASAEVVFELEVSRFPWGMAFFFGYSFYSWFFLDVSTFDSFVFIMYSADVSEPPVPPNIARCIPLKGHGEGLLNLRQDFLRIIWKKAKIHTEDLRRKWFRM